MGFLYSDKKFQVPAPGEAEYRQGWDALGAGRAIASSPGQGVPQSLPKVVQAGVVKLVFPAQAGIQGWSLDSSWRWSDGDPAWGRTAIARSIPGWLV
jgi:hypothetical protein